MTPWPGSSSTRLDSYVVGGPYKDGFACQSVPLYTSFDSTPGCWPGIGGNVCYDPERWDQTPLIEQQHPKAFISAFASVAHGRGATFIAAPSRDLVYAPGADCQWKVGESIDDAYLRCSIPAAAAPADILICQSEGDTASVPAFTRLVFTAKAQQRDGQQLWAELTSAGNITTAQMLAAYKSVKTSVTGFWVNTNTQSVAKVVAFFKAVAAGA